MSAPDASIDRDPAFRECVARAAEAVAAADSIVICAGAGMGVDSGLPDFRGTTGFWQAYPALARAGITFERAASAAAFARDPRRGWGFYGHRLALYRQVTPHAGFAVLRTWCAAKSAGGGIFTSNVDGQFQRAGFDAAGLHECHGSIHHLQCTNNCRSAIWPADDYQPDVDTDTCSARGALPQCPHCGAPARPNILMFDDWLWAAERSDAQAARLERRLAAAGKLVVIEIGAGSAIPTVRHFSAKISTRYAAPLVRINAREHTVARAQDIGIAGSALEVLSAIDAALRDRAVTPYSATTRTAPELR